MNYRSIIGILCAVVMSSASYAQSAPDTSDYPYWIEMMSDPTINFYKTQRAFNIYWDGKTIDKGSGYKPFKRWEYSMLEIIDGQGNIPPAGYYDSIVDAYLATRASGGGGIWGIGGTIGNGSATCNQSGNWYEIGPASLPNNRTGQPTGLGRINAVAFHPNDSDIIFAGAPAGGLWKTTNGGKLWTTNTDSLATLGISAIAIDPTYPDTIYIGTGDRDASDSYGRGVFKSTDGGNTWIQKTSGLGNTIVSRLIIDPRNTSVVIAATSSGIFRTTNGGDSWSSAASGYFKDIVFDAVNPDIIYACQTSAKFYKSTDNGVTWTQVTNGLPTNKSRMGVAVSPADSNLVYVVVTNTSTFAGLYKSHDRGASFSLMSDTPNIMDYSHLGTGTAGQAWYDLDIAVHPKQPNIVSVAGVNIFQSIDSGKTWKINAHWVGSGGAPAVHADNHVLEYQDGTDALFTGNDGGVYVTRDLGKDWTDISEGLAIAQIYRLGQSATHQNYLINGYQDNGTALYENAKWNTVIGGDGMDCVIDPTDVNYAYGEIYYGSIRRINNGYTQGVIAAENKNGITEKGGWITPYVLREGVSSTMFAGYKNIWRSTNIKATSTNSVTWTKISDNLGGINSQTMIALENSPANSDILYASRADNTFFKTSDANATNPSWTNLSSSLPAVGRVVWIESHPSNANRLWICQQNKVFQSDNGGSSWTNISNGLPNIPILCLVFDTSSKYQGMYAGTYMGVFYKDTTMTSWTWFNDNMPIHTRVRDIEIYYSPQGRSKSHVVCGTYGRGNWRSPLYDEDQLTPEPGFTAASLKTCAGEPVQFTDTSLNQPTNWYWKFSPSSVTYYNGTDSSSQNPIVSFNTPGFYTITFYAENCTGYDSVVFADYIETFQAVKSPTCVPFRSPNTKDFGIGIFDIKIDKYQYSSSSYSKEGAYIDLACSEVMDLKSDTTYVIEFTTGLYNDEYLKAYIDFNNDGDFNDANEEVASSYKRTNHTDSVFVPADAVKGEILRMRVISDYNPIKGPCDTINYGQTEDYGVVIDADIPRPHFTIDTNRICVNSKMVLSDSSYGKIYKYRWYVSKYGTLSYTTDKSSPVPVTFILPDTGWYYAQLVVNDSIASKRIDSIVYVSPYPTANFTIYEGSTDMCEGESIRFKNTSDVKLANFYWYKDNVKMGIHNDSIITIGNVFMKDSGVYHAVTEYYGCATVSNSIKVNVHPLPNARFTFDAMDSCMSTNQFNLKNRSTISGGAMQYRWEFGDGNISGAKDPAHTYDTTGNYTIKLITTTLKKCVDSASADVRVWHSPKANFSINQSPQCLVGNAFTFTNGSNIGGGGMTYSWDLGDGNSASGLHASTSYAAADSFDVTLIASSAYNCHDTVSKKAVVAPDPVGAIRVTRSDSCLKTNKFDFEDGSTISNGNIFSFDWNFGDGTSSSNKDIYNHSYTNSGSFDITYIVTSDAACTDTVYSTVRVYPSATANFDIDDSVQCFNGHSINLTNSSTVSSGGSLTYQWDYGDGNSDSRSNPSTLTYGTSGTYTIELVAATPEGCNDTLAKQVFINPSPQVSFNGENGCVGESINFTNSSVIESGSIDSFHWAFGDRQSENTQSPSHVYTKAGIYEVKLVAVSDMGCSDSLIIKQAAEIYDNPNADFSYTKLGSFDAQTEIRFDDSSEDATRWRWNVEGNIRGTDPSYTHIFTDTGYYQIMLLVENDNGCGDTAVKLVFVVPDANLLVPTAFSPNSDDLNDAFRPLGVQFVKYYRVRIYDRWGAKVFESSDATETWDGMINGTPVPQGIYSVIVEVTDYNNEKTKYKGPLYIIR